MNARKAHRIRFGLLAARSVTEPERLNHYQVGYLESCELAGWMIGDAGTIKAHDREWLASKNRRDK